MTASGLYDARMSNRIEKDLKGNQLKKPDYADRRRPERFDPAFSVFFRTFPVTAFRTRCANMPENDSGTFAHCTTPENPDIFSRQ
jgi:hypothetical protein